MPTTDKKSELHGAAAESRSNAADPKGGASKDKPKTPSAKPLAKVPGPKASGGEK